MVSTFPWIIAILGALVLALIAFRFVLMWRERRLRTVGPEPIPYRPPATKPGSPLVAASPPPAVKKAQQPAKPTPLQLRIVDAPDLARSDFQDDARVQHDFGEMLSAICLAAQGWKRLPAKLQTGRGIDGLFVREVRGGGGFECLALKTETNSASYDPASMEDGKLSRDIEQLFAVSAFDKTTIDELLRGLRQGPSFFRKELWRHDLSSGLTTVVELGKKGERGKSVTRSNARIMAALFTALEQLDRRSLYVGAKPVDDAIG